MQRMGRLRKPDRFEAGFFSCYIRHILLHKEPGALLKQEQLPADCQKTLGERERAAPFRT